jgi:hypothetical protein
MRSVSSARAAIALAVLLVLAGAVASLWPFITRDRAAITASPSPGPRSADHVDIPLRPRSELCVAPVTIDTASAVAAFTVNSPTVGTTRVDVLTSAPGYRRRAALDVDLRASGTPVNAPVGPPPRRVTGRVCVRNATRHRIALAGTNNPQWIGVARTSIDGRELQNQAIALTLLEPRSQSILDRLGTIVRHATDLTGGAVPFAVGWLIIVGFVVATPVAILLLFWLALRESGLDD